MNSASGNGVAPARQNPLKRLAELLTDPHDRETFAALVSSFDALPPDDEVAKIMQLLGFFTLFGRELPETLVAERKELRELLLKARAEFVQLVKTNAGYHDQLSERLKQLPQEISAGVQPEVIARTIGESFRQQIAQVGLQDTARLLNTSVRELKQVANELDQAVKPLENRYSGIGSTIQAEVKKLDSASSQLRQQTDNLTSQLREERWLWRFGKWLLLLALGFFLGQFWEKNQTTSEIVYLQQQMEQLQQGIKALPATLNPPAAKQPKGAAGKNHAGSH